MSRELSAVARISKTSTAGGGSTLERVTKTLEKLLSEKHNLGMLRETGLLCFGRFLGDIMSRAESIGQKKTKNVVCVGTSSHVGHYSTRALFPGASRCSSEQIVLRVSFSVSVLLPAVEGLEKAGGQRLILGRSSFAAEIEKSAL